MTEESFTQIGLLEAIYDSFDRSSKLLETHHNWYNFKAMSRYNMSSIPVLALEDWSDQPCVFPIPSFWQFM